MFTEYDRKFYNNTGHLSFCGLYPPRGSRIEPKCTCKKYVEYYKNRYNFEVRINDPSNLRKENYLIEYYEYIQKGGKDHKWKNETKIQRGDHMCDLDRFYDNSINLPFESVTLKCSYQNTNYSAIKCDYTGLCDYAKQIDMDDIREAPELFDNNVELYGEK